MNNRGFESKTMHFYNFEIKERTKGITATLLLSFIILFFFFSPILFNPNVYYFSKGGDGLQTYFQAIYHTKYDSSLVHQQSINYPYGESVFFTGCMPSITNGLKLLKPIIDLSDQTVGIINLLMLLSIPLSALFIFLLFHQLKVHWLYGAFCAVGIAFLSPQIDRLGGHLALTFQFALPAYIYLLSLFYKSPDFKKSLLIGTLVFFLSSQHLYFFGFAGLVSCIFFLILYVKKELINTGRLKLILHFIIQIALPYLTLQLILFFSSNVTDRTSFPWGFLVYKANPTSIFYPSDKWYEPFIHLIATPVEYEWEGRAYVGLTAIIILACLIILAAKNLFTKKKFILSGNPFLDIMLIASLGSLAYSFGFPFIFYEDLLKYSGPLKQMRGIGRFSWFFYYVINSIGFYLLFEWTKKLQLPLKLIIYCASIALLFSEAYVNLVRIEPMISNKIPELEDSKNALPQDQWVNQLNPKDYQAILPLPYFHIGSENFTFGNHGKITNYSYIASLKTSLPLYAVSASRTSLSQTFKNISFVTNNSAYPELPPLIQDKPLLVICIKEELNEEELLLYNKSTFLFKNENYEIRKLYPKTLKEIYIERKNKITNEYAITSPKPSDSIYYKLLTFDHLPNINAYKGSGALEFGPDENKIIYNSTLFFPDTSKTFSISFWMFDYRKDVYARSIIKINQTDSTGKQYLTKTTNPLWTYKQFNKEWALIEFSVTLQNRNDTLKLTLYNPDLKHKDKFIIDHIMLKPYHRNVYLSDSLYISKNNRDYLK